MVKKIPKEEWEERMVFSKADSPQLFFALMYFIVGFAFIISCTLSLIHLRINIVFFMALFFVCMKEGLSLLVKSGNTALRAWKVVWKVKKNDEDQEKQK